MKIFTEMSLHKEIYENNKFLEFLEFSRITREWQWPNGRPSNARLLSTVDWQKRKWKFMG